MNKKRISKRTLFTIIGFTIFILMIWESLYYKKYHPNRIYLGENSFKLGYSGYYDIEERGLESLRTMIDNSQNSTKNYNIKELVLILDKNGCNLSAFTMIVTFFDEDEKEIGIGKYEYTAKKNLRYQFESTKESGSYLDYYQSIDYIESNIKRIPFYRQFNMSYEELYILTYNPNNKLTKGTFIIDGMNGKEIESIGITNYLDGLSGVSSGGYYWTMNLKSLSDEETSFIYVFEDRNYLLETVE